MHTSSNERETLTSILQQKLRLDFMRFNFFPILSSSPYYFLFLFSSIILFLSFSLPLLHSFFFLHSFFLPLLFLFLFCSFLTTYSSFFFFLSVFLSFSSSKPFFFLYPSFDLNTKAGNPHALILDKRNNRRHPPTTHEKFVLKHPR